MKIFIFALWGSLVDSLCLLRKIRILRQLSYTIGLFILLQMKNLLYDFWQRSSDACTLFADQMEKECNDFQKWFIENHFSLALTLMVQGDRIEYRNAIVVRNKDSFALYEDMYENRPQFVGNYKSLISLVEQANKLT